MLNIEQQKNRLKAIRKAIHNPAIKYISFDVFDTLLVRPVIKPTDLFDIMQHRIHQFEKYQDVLFKNIRIHSEQAARKKISLLVPNYEDITLDEIYECMSEIFGFIAEDVDFFKSVELEVEKQYLTPRKSIEPLYQLAADLGKKIIIVSDVYLSTSFLKQVLELNGYDRTHAYFVSSDLRKSKGRGGLFPYILNYLGCRPGEICHIGDNLNADKVNADKVKIRAFHWPKTIDLMEQGRVNFSIWNGKIVEAETAYRLLYGMIINNVFDTIPREGYNANTLFNGNPYFLGYYGLGTFVFALTKWINKSTLQKNSDTINLIARDGYLLLQAFDILKPFLPGECKPKYLRISRSVCYPFDVVHKHQLLVSDRVLHYDRKQSVRSLLESRLFLKIDEAFEDYLKSSGINPDDNCQNYVYLDLMNTALEYSKDMMAGLKKQRDLASRYYREEFKGQSSPVIFDLGYSGRAQRILTKILDKPVHGLYGASFEKVMYNSDQHSYDNFIHPSFQRDITKEPFNTAILEFLLSESSAGTITAFEEKDKDILPILSKSEYSDKNLRLIKTIQTGALDFIRNVATTFGNDIDFMNITPITSYKLLQHFMLSPDKADAKILNDIVFFNGITNEKMSIIGNSEANSKWKQGFRSLHTPRNKFSESLSQRAVDRFRLLDGKIVFQEIHYPIDLNKLRVLKSQDFIDAVALLGKENPPLHTRQECVAIIKNGKAKLFAAATLLTKCGGIGRAHLSFIDKIICRAVLIRGR